MATRADLLQLTMEEFAFLPETGECELEVIEPNTLLTTVAYKFRTIAVELQFDWRDLDVTCCISMPSKGRLPEGYLLHDGKRIRFRLGDLTPDVLAKFRQLPRPPKRRPPLDEWAEQQSERMIDYIRIYAEIIRSNFADLRSKAEAGFYPD
jgi:hypothetical protein